MSDKAIPAATVILLRDEPSFEVLMVERHADIGFAGGALVFPGGRIDAGDADPRWAHHARGLDARYASAQVAAIREAFEETGLLIAREADDQEGSIVGAERAAALQHWRGDVEADDSAFLEMIASGGLALACDALALFAHWIGPSGAPKRFDTLFFAACCPVGQVAREDGREATDVVWFAPDAAITARARDERKIIFPTARNLELLALSDSAEGVLASARQRRIEPITPFVRKRDGVAVLVIPEGLGYPITEEPLETAMRG